MTLNNLKISIKLMLPWLRGVDLGDVINVYNRSGEVIQQFIFDEFNNR